MQAGRTDFFVFQSLEISAGFFFNLDVMTTSAKQNDDNNHKRDEAGSETPEQADEGEGVNCECNHSQKGQSGVLLVKVMSKVTSV